MAKKLLIIPLVLFGLVVVIVGVSGQVATPAQLATPDTPVPLLSPVSVDPSVVPETNLSPGIRSPHVKKVQEALKALGYLPAGLETIENFGPKTRQAIIKFQKDQGLPAFGFYGPATRAALKNELFRKSVSIIVLDKNVDIVCMKTAVEKRENALLSAYDTYTGKIKTARETRKTALLAAWSIQDPKERHSAIKAAWEKYRESVKTARNEWNQSRRTIWIQFAQDARNCRASAVETQDLEKVEIPEE
jgi:hypothetical protein